MKRTLTLTRETLTELTADELAVVAGAGNGSVPVLPHSLLLPVCPTDACTA